MKIKFAFISVLSGLFLACVNPAVVEVIQIDVSKDIVSPKEYMIVYTTNPIEIDGIPEDHWNKTKFTDPFIDISNEALPYYSTKTKMLWDSTYLYVYAELEEEHIWANLKQKDTVIFYNNDFEVFIDPSNDTKNYAEIEVNALNTVWDLCLDKPYRDGGKAKNNFDLNGLQSAVYHYGSLNNPTDIDSMWTIEIAIPMSGLIELKDKPRTLPEEGEFWRINFSRVQWQYEIIDGYYDRKKDNNSNYLNENNWVWTGQKVVNMHEPEKWGLVRFTHFEDILNDSIYYYPYANEFDFEQAAYAIFRRIKGGDLSYLNTERIGTKKLLDVHINERFSANEGFFKKTEFGFEAGLKSPKSFWYIINEKGELLITFKPEESE